MNSDGLLTPEDAAPLLGLAVPQVRALIVEGRLESHHDGGQDLISVASLVAYKDAERECGMVAMKKFTDLENRLGLFE